MEEKIFSYQGDVWEIFTKGEKIHLRCIATNADPDFPVSEIIFDMESLMTDMRIDNNPPFNEKNGGKITMYHAKRGIEVLTLLVDIVAMGKRIK
jgi:hypothetical protein